MTSPYRCPPSSLCLCFVHAYFYPQPMLIMWNLNTLRPRQNGRRFADDTFKRIFLNENVRISIKISLKFVPKNPINNNPSLVQIMAWCRSGDKPLSEPMMVNLLTHIYASLGLNELTVHHFETQKSRKVCDGIWAMEQSTPAAEPQAA